MCIEKFINFIRTTENKLKSYLVASFINEGENFNLFQYLSDHYLGSVSQFAVDIASVPGSSSTV